VRHGSVCVKWLKKISNRQHYKGCPDNLDSGIIITLAHPEATVYYKSSWYTRPLEWVGIANRGLLPFGHAALILVNVNDGELVYAAFGEYGSAPVGFGKVKSSMTNPELELDVRAEIDSEVGIANINNILSYLATHPDDIPVVGTINAAVIRNVSYANARKCIDDIVYREAVPYGALSVSKMTCNSFVYKVVSSALKNRWIKLRLMLMNTPFITPLGCVLFAPRRDIYAVTTDGNVHAYAGRRIVDLLGFYLPRGALHSLPLRKKIRPTENAQWLGTIFEGRWFELVTHNSDTGIYRITAFLPSSEQVFDLLFAVNDKTFDPLQEYRFDFVCDALRCHVVQNGKRYRFEAVTQG
jgi:hypothetical protein